MVRSQPRRLSRFGLSDLWLSSYVPLRRRTPPFRRSCEALRTGDAIDLIENKREILSRRKFRRLALCLPRQGRCRALSDSTPSPVDHSWSRSPPDEPDECHPDRETAGDHASVDGVSTGSGSTISGPWSSAELMMVRAVDSYSATRFETSVMFDLYLLRTPRHRTAPMLNDQDP